MTPGALPNKALQPTALRAAAERPDVRRTTIMDPFLMCLGVLAVGEALAVAGVWRLLPGDSPRPLLVRAGGAIAGGPAGALIAEPQVAFIIQKLGYIQEAAGMKILFTVPFLLPLTTGLAAWLLSEVLGGRTRKPFRNALSSVIGAALGAGLVFVPWFFMSPAPAWISYPILMGVPAAGSTLAILISARGVVPSNPALNPSGLRPAG
jgi:hypothetical protein